MPIVVPLLHPTDLTLQIDVSKIPSAEHPTLHQINRLSTALARYEQQFKFAVLLFDASEQESEASAGAVENGAMDWQTHSHATETLSAWKAMAARDGAMAVYHFGCTVEAIKSGLSACPTLNATVDQPAFRIARNLFAGYFPRYEDIRHVVAHVAEFSASIQQREMHAKRGPLRVTSGRVTLDVVRGPGALTQLSGDVHGNVYFVSFEGEVHGYEISQATGAKLAGVKTRIYSSLENGSITKPTS